MDADELKKLNKTNFFDLVVSYLAVFDKTTRDNYSSVLEDNKADVIVKKDTPEEVSIHFQHSKDSLANISFDFLDSELVNFRALILPVGYFKNKMAKKYFETLITFLLKLAKHTHAEVEEIEKNRIYILRYLDKLIRLNLDQSMSTGDSYVSIWCEFDNNAS